MATRKDPHVSFNFRLEIDGIRRAAFQEVGGLDSAIDVVEHREGGENITMRKYPGQVKYSNITCKGGINDTKYCSPEVDKLLNEARASTDDAVRKQKYDAASVILNEDLPVIYIGHQSWIWAYKKNVTGFVPNPDGMIRLQGVKKG